MSSKAITPHDHPNIPRTRSTTETITTGSVGGGSYSRSYTSDASAHAFNEEVDPEFMERHLRQLSFSMEVPQDIEKLLQVVQNNGAETSLYQPVATLLTTLSKKIYESLSNDQKDVVKARHGVSDAREPHITFIDHHRNSPTHFPRGVLSDVRDAPDILGVRDGSQFPLREEGGSVYHQVPHHRVDTIVEIKPYKQGHEGPPQAEAYAYRHLQARPDHPSILLLVVRPQAYQVLLSDTNGVIASAHTSWDQLDLLYAYLYSLYLPPDKHVFFDPTTSWYCDGNDDALPKWSITVKTSKGSEERFVDGRFVFIGEPWSRRTSIFSAKDGDGDTVIIKEYYLHYTRMFQEDRLLKHIHENGDVPGVARLRSAHVVTVNGKPLQCGSAEDGNLRTKMRFALWDSGEPLESARTVNDLLCCFYDALEAHRTMLTKRDVLHRDMSKFNILIYPRWSTKTKTQMMLNAPPLIRDLLSDEPRPVQDRKAACLVIDLDHGARLDAQESQVNEELTFRTGTPTYVARAVSVGAYNLRALYTPGVQMPLLPDEIRARYEQAHSAEPRYAPYNDADGTRHGALRPQADEIELSTLPDSDELPGVPPFRHRSEHDVESIYWSMVCALLRVRPKSFKVEPYATGKLATAWRCLNSHEIPDLHPDAPAFVDLRSHILDNIYVEWRKLLPPEMKDVAILMWQISQHVRPEYGLWEWEDGKFKADHLHEAVQRLIFRYLYEHRDKDIELDPTCLRPTEPMSEEMLAKQAAATPRMFGAGAKKPASPVVSKNLSQRSQAKAGSRNGSHISVSKTNKSAGTRRRASAHKGLARVISGLQERASAEPQVGDVRGRKRTNPSQGGRALKSMKSSSGSPIPTREPDED